MTKQISELTKVEKIGNIWTVQVLSPVVNVGWIVQGEHTTKEAAESDRKNWA